MFERPSAHLGYIDDDCQGGIAAQAAEDSQQLSTSITHRTKDEEAL